MLTCPNCGNVTEVADVMIPSARLTARCSRCGAKVGGTVPARLDSRADKGSRGKTHKQGRKPMGRPREASDGDGKERDGAPEQRAPAAPSAERGGAPAKGLPAVTRGLAPERLARLVASDMLLYNRDKVERSIAGGRLLSSMATEIVEAWEFYKKRAGENTALGTSYFRDALNDVLGGGKPIV